jgi:glycine cleavage system regulatory protein
VYITPFANWFISETMKKGVPNFAISNYIPFVESICIEINNGKDSEELDTIPKVMAAWNARRDLAVSLRTDENIHRGMILNFMKAIPAMDRTEIVREMLTFISTKELKRVSFFTIFFLK